MNKQKTLAQIEATKVVAVVRLQEAALFEPVALALYEGGVRAIEITMTVPGALAALEKAISNLPSEIIIGVGSVLNAKTTEKAVNAGAQFIVSPVTKKEILDACKTAEVAVMPGAFTPTEIQTAWEWGADIVKVFPADILGMKFFKGVKAPMPHLKLMPTGGVSLTNAAGWIQAGACAVGVGSALLDKEALRDRNFEQIKKNAERLISNLKTINQYG